MSSSDVVVYVEVKRDSGKCIVQCRVSPEQKIRSKLNKVTAWIGETSETVWMFPVMTARLLKGVANTNYDF